LIVTGLVKIESNRETTSLTAVSNPGGAKEALASKVTLMIINLRFHWRDVPRALNKREKGARLWRIAQPAERPFL
jgi:hypothetical protein